MATLQSEKCRTALAELARVPSTAMHSHGTMPAIVTRSFGDRIHRLIHIVFDKNFVLQCFDTVCLAMLPVKSSLK